MSRETFTEWAERNGLDLAPWQIELGERVVQAIDQGERITVINNKRGGHLTVGNAIHDYWADR